MFKLDLHRLLVLQPLHRPQVLQPMHQQPGIATYASTAGIATYASTAGIATYASTAGIATYASTAGIATYASTAGIATNATYASTAGIATVAEGLTGSPDIIVGNITASGDVSIAGTITYQDVSAVDSAGIVTARSGIHVLAGGIDVQAGVVTSTDGFDGDLTGNVTGNADTATSATNAQGLTGTPDITVGSVTATSLSGDGSSLTSLNASQLSSGTIPDERFPSTLPAVSGENLTNLPSSGLSQSTADNRYVRLENVNQTVNGTKTFSDTFELSKDGSPSDPCLKFPNNLNLYTRRNGSTGSSLTNSQDIAIHRNNNNENGLFMTFIDGSDASNTGNVKIGLRRNNPNYAS